MQISTIDIRVENVERSSSRKKDAHEDGPDDSAFAAFFAHAQQDVHRKSSVKVHSHDADNSVDRVIGGEGQQTGAASGQQEVESEAAPDPTLPAPKTDASSPDADVAGGPARANAPVVHVTAEDQLRSHAKYTVAPSNGMAPEAKTVDGSAQITEPVAAVASVAGQDVLTEAQQSKAAGTFVPPSTSVPGSVVELDFPAQALHVPSVAAAASAESKQVPLPTALESGEEVALPETTVIPNEASAEAGSEDDDALAEEPKSKAAGPTDSGDEPAPKGETEVRAKVPVSRATSHAVARGPATAKSTASAEVIALPGASDASTTTHGVSQPGVVDELAGKAGAATRTAAERLDAARPADLQPVRNVTQLVTPDGVVIATQTTESRSEGAHASGVREVVVVERTTLQALPEQALRGVRFLVNNGEYSMRIRLVPESLGEVRLEVVASKGEVSVTLVSASAAVREILQTQAHGLQNSIAQDSSSAVRVTVTSDASSNTLLSNNAQRHNNQQGAHGQHQPTAYQVQHQGPVETTRRVAAHAGNLNVYV